MTLQEHLGGRRGGEEERRNLDDGGVVGVGLLEVPSEPVLLAQVVRDPLHLGVMVKLP